MRKKPYKLQLLQFSDTLLGIIIFTSADVGDVKLNRYTLRFWHRRCGSHEKEIAYKMHKYVNNLPSCFSHT